MREVTHEEIVKKMEEIWDGEGGFTCNTYPREGGWDIELRSQYDSLSLGFKKLLQISEFFGTKNIDESRWHQKGCETCDYGAVHELTIHVREE